MCVSDRPSVECDFNVFLKCLETILIVTDAI